MLKHILYFITGIICILIVSTILAIIGKIFFYFTCPNIVCQSNSYFDSFIVGIPILAVSIIIITIIYLIGEAVWEKNDNN